MSALEAHIEEIAEARATKVAEDVARQVVAELTSNVPVTLTRASEITGINRETLEKWITQGRLKTYPCIGRLRMVKISDIVWED